MAPVNSNWEKEFLGEPIAELPDDHLPTLGEVLRCFYYHRKATARTKGSRRAANVAVTKCIEIWNKFEIPTALYHNMTRNLLKLLTLFKGIPYIHNEGTKKKKEILWRRKLNHVFDISAKDSIEKSSRKNKKLLQLMQKEAEELEKMENSMIWKRKWDDIDTSAMSPSIIEKVKKRPSLKENAQSTDNAEHTMKRCRNRKWDDIDTSMTSSVIKKVKKRAILKENAQSTDNAEHTMKRCKVMVSKLTTKTDSDNELIEKLEILSSRNPNFELSKCSSSIDVQPEDEDIIPPNLPSVIIKEEIIIDWNENEDVQRDNGHDNFEDCSIGKDLTFPDKQFLHNFVENNKGCFKI